MAERTHGRRWRWVKESGDGVLGLRLSGIEGARPGPLGSPTAGDDADLRVVIGEASRWHGRDGDSVAGLLGDKQAARVLGFTAVGGAGEEHGLEEELRQW